MVLDKNKTTTATCWPVTSHISLIHLKGHVSKMVFQLGVTTFNAKVEKSLGVTLKTGIIRVVISLSSEGGVILTTEDDDLDNRLDLLPIIVDLALH